MNFEIAMRGSYFLTLSTDNQIKLFSNETTCILSVSKPGALSSTSYETMTWHLHVSWETLILKHRGNVIMVKRTSDIVQGEKYPLEVKSEGSNFVRLLRDGIAFLFTVQGEEYPLEQKSKRRSLICNGILLLFAIALSLFAMLFFTCIIPISVQNVVPNSSIHESRLSRARGPAGIGKEIHTARPLSSEPPRTRLTHMEANNMLTPSGAVLCDRIGCARLTTYGSFVLDGEEDGAGAFHTGYYDPDQYLLFQEDGNLVLYDSNNKARWASDTANQGCSSVEKFGNALVFQCTTRIKFISFISKK